jgi:hypothetical protein
MEIIGFVLLLLCLGSISDQLFKIARILDPDGSRLDAYYTRLAAIKAKEGPWWKFRK